jgi:hypothetical protein
VEYHGAQGRRTARIQRVAALVLGAALALLVALGPVPAGSAPGKRQPGKDGGFPQSFKGKVEYKVAPPDDPKPPPTHCRIKDSQTGEWVDAEQCFWNYNFSQKVSFPHLKFLRVKHHRGQFEVNVEGTGPWDYTGFGHFAHVWTELAPPPQSGPGDTPRTCTYRGGFYRKPNSEISSGSLSIDKKNKVTATVIGDGWAKYSHFGGDCTEYVGTPYFMNPEDSSWFVYLTGVYHPAKDRIVLDAKPPGSHGITVKGELDGPP